VVFDFIVAEDVLPKILLGYGPVPRVVGTSGNTGPWDLPGSRRTVHLGDGGTAQEEVTSFSRPDYFAYRVSDFSNRLLRLLAREARGEWWFTATGGGTAIRWRYAFVARSVAVFPLLFAFAHVLWRGYMRVCLDAAQTQLVR
jgi:Polyketide cyclase / dehydrase and lipid transport